MPYFKDADEVYATLGALFVGLVEDAEMGPALRAADAIVEYVYRRPDARVTCRLLAAEELRVDLGDSDLVPEVTLTMDADVGHRFWLGKVNPTFAVARGQIKTSGQLGKVMALAPLVKPIVARYRAQLEAMGRGDLLNV